MRAFTWSFFVASLATLTPQLALADAHTLQEAKRHSDAATSHYAVGEFVQAAEEYETAFKLKNLPALLYNAAQSRRLANQPEKALILYRNYVGLYPDEPNVEEVRAQIAKIKDALAAAEKAKTAPPTGTVVTRPGELEPKPDQKPLVVTPAIAQDTPRPTPVYKKWWLWTIVGVVVAGGVVAIAVVLTVPSGTWANGPTVGPGAGAALTFQNSAPASRGPTLGFHF